MTQLRQDMQSVYDKVKELEVENERLRTALGPNHILWMELDIKTKEIYRLKDANRELVKVLKNLKQQQEIYDKISIIYIEECLTKHGGHNE